MWIKLDTKSNTPLTRQLYTIIKEMILDGSLISNEKLPSTRTLASELCVSRNTILEVYNQLTAEGYLEGHHGSGTVVAAGVKQQSKISHPKSICAPLMPKVENENLIDFRSGVPDLAFFPRKEWAKLYYQVCNDLPPSALRYNQPAGVEALRNAISQYLYRTRGINCTPTNIMIVSGSTQGLSLISKLLYREKQEVIVEDPIHHGLLNVISSAGYNITGVQADDNGLNTNDLKPSDQTSFVYTTPSHQYPLGGVLPVQRRLSLIQYSLENECYIVEDDYDSEFRFEGQPIHSLYELNPDKVIYIGSFSKILAPAIRLGFVLLPNELLAKYKTLKMYSDVHTEAISQYVLAQFIQSGGLEKHIWKMKRKYNQKRQHLIHELTTNFSGEFEIKGHAAGLHVLVYFYDVIFTEKLVKQIYSNQVKIYPVEDYAVQHFGKHKNEIILGYAHLSLSDITNGIQVLSNIIHKCLPQ
jgi:GntR family transcriptional regulator/MocR family aminotransferase